MPKYTPWTWSAPHGRHYSYLIADDGATILDTFWSGHPGASTASTAETPSDSTPRSGGTTGYSRTSGSSAQGSTLGANYTYSSNPTHSGSTHEEEEDDDGEDDDDDDGEDDEEEPKTVASQAVATAARPDSGISYGSQQSPYTTQAYATARQPSVSQSSYGYQYGTGYNTTSAYQSQPQYASSAYQSQPARNTISTLPADVQATIGYKDRRFIQTGADRNETESLDTRYRRVAKPSHAYFFKPGRVFKMLWIEPAGQANPGKTRNSTHFSTVWCGEQAYSEIRRFVVVRNKGTFSQCIPIQTYKGRGATKPGLVMHDHGVIHTTLNPPHLILGENLTKYSIRVEPTANEVLEPQSRVNYGKAYAVEHNVKVLDIGMVVEGHRYLIEEYFDRAMRGQ